MSSDIHSGTAFGFLGPPENSQLPEVHEEPQALVARTLEDKLLPCIEPVFQIFNFPKRGIWNYLQHSEVAPGFQSTNYLD